MVIMSFVNIFYNNTASFVFHDLSKVFSLISLSIFDFISYYNHQLHLVL